MCFPFSQEISGKHINNLTPTHFRDNPARLFMFIGFFSPPKNSRKMSQIVVTFFFVAVPFPSSPLGFRRWNSPLPLPPPPLKSPRYLRFRVCCVFGCSLSCSPLITRGQRSHRAQNSGKFKVTKSNSKATLGVDLKITKKCPKSNSKVTKK